jgi:hypothetical protein
MRTSSKEDTSHLKGIFLLGTVPSLMAPRSGLGGFELCHRTGPSRPRGPISCLHTYIISWDWGITKLVYQLCIRNKLVYSGPIPEEYILYVIWSGPIPRDQSIPGLHTEILIWDWVITDGAARVVNNYYLCSQFGNSRKKTW